MKRRAVLLSAYTLPALACGKESEVSAPSAGQKNEVAIAIHDSNGVSFESAWDGVSEVILFKPHTHIHLKISNVSGKPLTLWQPYCPEGDLAMVIEFRELRKPDEVFRSGLRMGYTAGMGFPKVFKLAPGGDLIVNVDLVEGYWTLPIAFAEAESREVEMRAVYEPAEKAMLKTEGKELRAWGGKAVSPWHKVRISNRTGKAISANRSVK